MKFVHLSDLHIGKRVNEYSMIEDQQYILSQIIKIIDDVNPDGVIIAGDVYDKPVPSAEAVGLFDDFLYRLSKRQLQVFVISGNHDSAERIAFGSRLMSSSGIHMSPVFDGQVEPISMSDEHGEVCIYMLPFIKPAHVRRFYGEDINSYTEAMRAVIENMEIDISKRNILITHQFVTGSTRCESEDISVGGTDNVDIEIFESFDYVALGHLHSPQKCIFEWIRYCGTPLKYSFSEAKDNKSVTVLDFAEKGNLSISTVPLTPLRDMVEIKGTYDEIIAKKFYEDTTYTTDYVHITLTDEEDVPNALGLLRTVYKNLMKLDYDNKRTRQGAKITGATDVERKSPLELFSDFYKEQNNQPMNEEQESYILRLIESIWEDEA